MKTGEFYQVLAQLVQARLNCINCGSDEWKAKHEERILKLVSEHMPSGSGFDNGTDLDLDVSTGERLVFQTNFHHMDQYGGYTKWTCHEVFVTPSLQFDFMLRITGEGYHDIKPYIREQFDLALGKEVE